MAEEKKKKKIVRKKKEAIKCKFLKIRVTESEYEKFKAMAKKAELSLSNLIRQSMDRVRAWTPEEIKNKEKLIFQVAKIGNNLNQIARAVNTQNIINHEIEIYEMLQQIDNDLKILIERK